MSLRHRFGPLHDRASRRRASLVVASAMVAGGSVACGSGSGVGGDALVTRVDSAGIEVVTLGVDRDRAPVFAAPSTSPPLRIGSIDGRPAEQFGVVRDLVGLPDGGVAVIDGQAAELRVFGPSGEVVLVAGSRGDGPGELRGPTTVGLLPGDTFALYDPLPHRVTRFTGDGELAGVTRLEEARARTSASVFLPDGRLVTQSAWINPAGRAVPGPEPTFVRDTMALVVYGVDGAARDTLDIVPGRESISSVRVSGDAIAVLRRPAAFGRSNVFAADRDGVWSAESDRFELRYRSSTDGALRRIVRAPGLERPTTDAVAEAVSAEARSEAEGPEELRMAELWYDLSPRPRVLPAFDRLLTDDRGRLWVHEWPVSGVSPRWWVFERDGRLLGSVSTPDGFETMSVRCGWVWGVERDELDVSYVVRLDLLERERCETT